MSQVDRETSARAVNDDMRRAAANLALIIRECGLSQSELARRSGVSRQLVNGWARQRLSVSLSATVARFLSCVQFTLGDLLLEEPAIYAKFGKSAPGETRSSIILPRLVQASRCSDARKRLAVINGTFRCRTRAKERPELVLEHTILFRRPDGEGSDGRNPPNFTARAFRGPGSKADRSPKEFASTTNRHSSYFWNAPSLPISR